MTSAVRCVDGPDAGGLWHNGDPLREQRSLADGRGVVDLSHHDVLTVSGPDRLGFLHSLTTQKLDTLTPGESATALVLSPTGHIEHGLDVVDDGTRTWIHAEPGAGANLARWLSQMRFMSRVEIEERADVALVWIPRAEPADAGRVLVARDSQLGGLDLFVNRDGLPAVLAAEADGVIGGAWAYEAVRIAAGIPRVGVDTDHRTLPNEIGLLGTHLNKGYYRGQETVARVHNLGRPPRRLIRLHLDGACVAAGAEIVVDGQARGRVGASAMHHELGPIALGLIKRNVEVSAALEVAGVAAAQEVLVDPEVGLHIKPTLG